MDHPVQPRGALPGSPGNLRRERLSEGSLRALSRSASEAAHLHVELHHPSVRRQVKQSPLVAAVDAARQLTADRAGTRRCRWMRGDDDPIRPGLDGVDLETGRQQWAWIQERHRWRSLANGTRLQRPACTKSSPEPRLHAD